MEILSKKEISDLDIYIEQLKLCLPLEECQIKNLCEKVKKHNLYNKPFITRQKKFF